MDKLPYREFLAFTAMTSGAQTERYLGGDMSLLPSYEEQRTVYKDYDGKRVDLLPFLRQQGWNMVRVRLMIVETAAYYSHENDPWATADKYSEFYPISTEGQAQFTRELVTELKRHQNVIGLFWWFPVEVYHCMGIMPFCRR